MTSHEVAPAWLARTSAWLTPRRIRAHAIVLAACLWGVCAIDYATPGLFDRAGNIKFQDFLQFPISARLITEGHANDLYDDQILASGIQAIVGRQTNVFLRYFYGPQVALLFVPLIGLPFLIQAEIWVGLSLLIYSVCIYLLLKICTNLRLHAGIVAACAVAYPPVFHFFVRGQLSAMPLLCLTAAYLFFRARREWMAGIALGCLAFKPQLLVAIPFVLLLARAWKPLAGLAISGVLQILLTFLYFRAEVMRLYFRMLLHSAAAPATTELSLSSIQMHSLHSFWDLLIPWPRGVWVLYLVSSFIVIGVAGAIWKSSSSLHVRFSALVFASVLVNPHIYIYDLLALAPALLVLTDWTLTNANHAATPLLRPLLYLAFILPLLGPLARWTHLQLSVLIFLALLWTLYRMTTHDQELISVPKRSRQTGEM
jgi:alpha-1,2-mannosyltransferase